MFDRGVTTTAQSGSGPTYGVVRNNVGFYAATSDASYAAAVGRCNNSIAAHRYRRCRAGAGARACTRRVAATAGAGRVGAAGGRAAYRNRQTNDDGAAAGVAVNLAASQARARGGAATQDAVAAAGGLFAGRTT